MFSELFESLLIFSAVVLVLIVIDAPENANQTQM